MTAEATEKCENLEKQDAIAEMVKQ